MFCARQRKRPLYVKWYGDQIHKQKFLPCHFQRAVVGPEGAVQQAGEGEGTVCRHAGRVQGEKVALGEAGGVGGGVIAHHADPVAVGVAGGDVGVVDHVPARIGQVVFLGGSAVRVLGHPADRGVFQVDDHRPAGVQLAVELVQAFVQTAGKAAVAGGRPDGPVRPHPGPRVDRPVQDGAGVAQGVQAALAWRLVAD